MSQLIAALVTTQVHILVVVMADTPPAPVSSPQGWSRRLTSHSLTFQSNTIPTYLNQSDFIL